jgi:hypothetical protein
MTTPTSDAQVIAQAMPLLRAAGTGTLLGHHNYPGYYVTVTGRVFSVRAGRFLKPVSMGMYLGLTVPDSTGKLVRRYLHRLILEIATGECSPGLEGRHLDGDRFNNALSNLAWGTRSQNANDKRRHGTDPSGERNGGARLTWESVREIRVRAASGARQIDLAREFAVSPMTISRVVRCQLWIEEST